MTQGPLCELVPIENAAMPERTVVQWDKDDLDSLGILKVDCLALGMLTCLAKGFDLIKRHYSREFDLATVPEGDPAVYDMICNADTIGVFQIESRAQMTMLPRLKPRTFYDLVIEVAIVRPGPIQGDMVHPYLRRRNGEEQVTYPSRELAEVLGKTMGVPLFQEQAMRIAIVAAGFTPDEADRLRRAMATFRKVGTIHTFQTKLVEGMVARGYDRGFAERCFRQIEGFGEYGFPESHAASFALLAYDSAWMKCHYPAVFACALLNSQPMGFYAPAQIVRDARDHGVTVLPVDVNCSDWDCTLEPAGDGGYALRLGLRQRRAAEGIFASQTTALELGFEVRQRARFALVASSTGEVAGQVHDEPEAVLKVPHFGFLHDPTPVESPVPEHEPRKRLDESRLEVALGERGEKNLPRVLRGPGAGALVGESRVPQTGEVPRQRRGTDARREFSLRPWDGRRCEVVELDHPPGQLRS